MLVLPNGEYELVDEDDLQRALDQGQITRKQYHEAYVIAHQLMIKIDEDFKTMQDKIMYCYHKIKHKPKAKSHINTPNIKRMSVTTMGINQSMQNISNT